MKWQSKLFPQLTLTEEHYRVMRRIYPHIESFKAAMEELEGWLYANQDRMPKKNWKNQVNNWMRKANEIAREKHDRRLAKGEDRPMTHRESAVRISEVLGRAGSEPSGEKS